MKVLKQATLALTLWLVVIIFLSISTGWNVPPVQAHAGYERSTPASNARLPQGKPPVLVQVWFAEPLEPRFSELTVFDKNGVRVDAGDSQVSAAEPKSMFISLKLGLPDGPYTVVFKNTSTEDGHTLKGSFAFVVGSGALPSAQFNSPLDLAEQESAANTTNNENANLWTISLRWLNYLSGTALVGALVFALLVWRKAIHRAKASKKMGPELNSGYKEGLGRVQTLVWISLGGLYLGWLGWFLYQAGAFSSQQLFGILGIQVAPGGRGTQALSDFLFGSRYGGVWLVRLGLLVLTTICWIIAVRRSNGSTITATSGAGGANSKGTRTTRLPLTLPGSKQFTRTLLPSEESGNTPPYSGEVAGKSIKAGKNLRQENSQPEADSSTTKIVVALENRFTRYWWWATAGMGAGVLLTTSLNSHAAGVTNWAWLAVGGDWLHLLSVGVWVGGLVALVLALLGGLAALRPGTGDRTRLLAALIPVFSQLAILSVATLVLTGIFQTFLQLRDIGELFSSPYGLSLVLKIVLLVPLLLLGAFNLLVVTPRVRTFARSKAAGAKEGAGSVAAGALGLKFRRSVLAEIILAFVILLAASLLTSQSPPRNVSATNSVLFFKFEQNGLKIDLAISPGALGDNTFEARLTDSNTGRAISDANLVNLRTAMLGMDMGEVQLELKASGNNNGRYIGQGSVLGMVGTWKATLLVQRNGQDDVNMPVTFSIK